MRTARMLVAAALVVGVFAGTAYAGEVTARVRTATCARPSFDFVVENSTNRYRKFTVVLWNAGAHGEELFLRDRVPAHGGIRGVVNPNWNDRSFWVVEVFRSWEWRPWNDAWRNDHWLAGASARLAPECGA
jgi:hypothetical protein